MVEFNKNHYGHDMAGLQEDELVRDWQENLSSYVNWIKNDPELYHKYIEFKVFMNLCNYQAKTGGLSFVKRDNFHYIEILDLGKIAIPAILKYVGIFNWPAFCLLYEICKYENIIIPKLPEEHRGKNNEVKNYWLNWGKNEGYIE